MPGGSVAVRILGVAATVRGFAYALTEGPGCLVDVNTQRKRARVEIAKELTTIVTRARPLFVAFGATKSKRGTAADVLDAVLTEVCERCGVMILRITRQQIESLLGKQTPTQREIGEGMSRAFPEIAHRLPPKASAWDGDDHRLGLFQAVAVGQAAWRMFRPPPIDYS